MKRIFAILSVCILTIGFFVMANGTESSAMLSQDVTFTNCTVGQSRAPDVTLSAMQDATQLSMVSKTSIPNVQAKSDLTAFVPEKISLMKEAPANFAAMLTQHTKKCDSSAQQNPAAINNRRIRDASMMNLVST